MAAYTKADILSALDNNTTYNFFLDLEHGYFYTAGSRISLFADDTRWAIVFEKSGFGNRSGRGELELNYYGNCLQNLDGAGLNDRFICNTKYLTLIDNDAFEEIAGGFELVARDAKTVRVRDKELLIEHDPEKYAAKGIEIQEYDNADKLIDYPALMRYLDEAYREALRATDAELRTCLPPDLPFLFKIDTWHHRSYSEWGGEAPSTYETFPLIADVLVTKDVSRWAPTLEANNNWRNWPEAGGL
jgi:hypothetical protein